jgi:hypothetical protein
MKTMLLAAIAAATIASGTASFAGEGNGPDFPAYNAGVAAVENHAIYATVPALTTGSAEAYLAPQGRQVRVQSNVAVAQTGSAGYPNFAGLAAQSPDVAGQLARLSQNGDQG